MQKLASVEDIKHETDMNGSRRRLLIAEDDRPFRELMAHVFRSVGYEVVAVANGVDLLDTLEVSSDPLLGSGAFDLVITDVRMPGRSGMSVFKELRNEGRVPPVVFVTGFGDPQVDRDARDVGALAVLDKPIDFDELRNLVNGYLSKAMQMQSGPAVNASGIGQK